MWRYIWLAIATGGAVSVFVVSSRELLKHVPQVEAQDISALVATVPTEAAKSDATIILPAVFGDSEEVESSPPTPPGSMQSGIRIGQYTRDDTVWSIYEFENESLIVMESEQSVPVLPEPTGSVTAVSQLVEPSSSRIIALQQTPSGERFGSSHQAKKILGPTHVASELRSDLEAHDSEVADAANDFSSVIYLSFEVPQN